MKHAVLIMAHKNKGQLIRLIHSLDCEEFDFFVHLDKHWKLNKTEIEEIKNSAKNVYLLNKRIHGELDHWSLPQISLNLADAALLKEKETGINYKYFLLLSGQDYPVKNKQYILDFLKTQYPKPLIDVEDWEENNWIDRKFGLVRWMNKIDEIYKNMKPSIFRKIRIAPLVVANKFEQIFFGSPKVKLKKYQLKIAGGSAWWILPHGVIDYINEQRKNNKHLIKELSRSWTPEETFFQIMTINSPYASKVDMDDEIYDDGIKSMTYPNFITPTKPFRGHPHIILVEDYERIMAKKALFARKFDDSVDSKVLDMIDESIKE